MNAPEKTSASSGAVKPEPAEEILTFRPMVFHDLHEVYYIEQSVFSYHWTYQNFQSSVANENIGVVLRNAAGKMVGYFVCMEVLDEMHLLKIAVAGDMHGKGYGRILMDKAVALAREREMAFMFLEVRPSNTPAVALYKNTGFKTVGVRKGYYADNHENALVMRLDL